MNIRKFTLVSCSVLLFFLFITGTVIMSQLISRTTAVNNSEKSSNVPFDDLLEPFIQVNKPVNILVLGGDKVNDNTDTIMLVNFDPSTAKANIVSIPRDTKVRIEGKIRKINFAYPHGGAKLAVETVSGLLGINIKYSIYIDTSVFRKIIDNLGGIKNFYVPQKLNYDDEAQNLHIHLDKGYQDLDGKKAEQFMRYRGYKSKVTDYYNGSDIKRIEAQQSLLKELVKQKVNLGYIHKFNEVVVEIFDNLETNMKFSEVLGLSQNISKFDYESANFFTLPGTDGYEDKISYYFLDNEKTEEMMKQYFNAEGSFDENESVTGSYYKYEAEGLKQYDEPQETTKKPTKKKSYIKNNPSNNETNVKKQQEPKP